MRARPVLTLLVALAAVLAGCGPWADPVVRGEEQALDALLALRDGAEVRATAELVLDEGELRDALRDDREALRLFREALDGGEATDVDALLEDLTQAQAELARHAVLLSTGADGSTRVAAQHDGTVWADLRVGSSAVPDDRLRLDVQVRVDWATASEVLDDADLLGQLDDAAAMVAPLLGDTPELDAVERLVLGFLGGELVGVQGELGPDLLAGLGLDDARSPLHGPNALGQDPRPLLATALHLDGHRREGEDTVVDVSVELAAVGGLVLDEVAVAPDAFGTTYEDVEAARAELARMPARLTDVATLRFDGAGVLRSLRVDVLDVLFQLEQAGDPDDERLAAAARLAGALDTSGLFVHVEVEALGPTATVLGDPTATATPAELAALLGTLFLGGLAGIEEPAADLDHDLGRFHEGGQPGGFESITARPTALGPGDVQPGECFDDEVLHGTAGPGAPATVDCAGPHDNEAFATVAIEAATYEELLTYRGDAVRCAQEFEALVGVPHAATDLVVDALRPTHEAFDAGERTSVCYVSGAGPLTGPMARGGP